MLGTRIYVYVFIFVIDQPIAGAVQLLTLNHHVKDLNGSLQQHSCCSAEVWQLVSKTTANKAVATQRRDSFTIVPARGGGVDGRH